MLRDPRVKRMGRRRIQMELIPNKNSRQQTFGKRKKGLFKKAYELEVLCDAKVHLTVATPDGKEHSFNSAVVAAEEEARRAIAASKQRLKKEKNEENPENPSVVVSNDVVSSDVASSDSEDYGDEDSKPFVPFVHALNPSQPLYPPYHGGYVPQDGNYSFTYGKHGSGYGEHGAAGYGDPCVGGASYGDPCAGYGEHSVEASYGEDGGYMQFASQSYFCPTNPQGSQGLGFTQGFMPQGSHMGYGNQVHRMPFCETFLLDSSNRDVEYHGLSNKEYQNSMPLKRNDGSQVGIRYGALASFTGEDLKRNDGSQVGIRYGALACFTGEEHQDELLQQAKHEGSSRLRTQLFVNQVHNGGGGNSGGNGGGSRGSGNQIFAHNGGGEIFAHNGGGSPGSSGNQLFAHSGCGGSADLGNQLFVNQTNDGGDDGEKGQGNVGMIVKEEEQYAERIEPPLCAVTKGKRTMVRKKEGRPRIGKHTSWS